MPRRGIPAGQEYRLMVRDNLPKKKTRKRNRFRGINNEPDPRGSRHHLLLSGLLRSAPELRRVMHLRARGLYRRSGITPCPEGCYSIVEDYNFVRQQSQINPY